MREEQKHLSCIRSAAGMVRGTMVSPPCSRDWVRRNCLQGGGGVTSRGRQRIYGGANCHLDGAGSLSLPPTEFGRARPVLMDEACGEEASDL